MDVWMCAKCDKEGECMHVYASVLTWSVRPPKTTKPPPAYQVNVAQTITGAQTLGQNPLARPDKERDKGMHAFS
jgi:hypothetical protein